MEETLEENSYIYDIAMFIYIILALCLAMFMFKENLSIVGEAALVFLSFAFISHFYRQERKENSCMLAVELAMIISSAYIILDDFHFLTTVH